jgi:hypothetical protein
MASDFRTNAYFYEAHPKSEDMPSSNDMNLVWRQVITMTNVTGVVVNDLVFDTNMLVKEDYDFQVDECSLSI